MLKDFQGKKADVLVLKDAAPISLSVEDIPSTVIDRLDAIDAVFLYLASYH
jgi:hypothetical protein